jgi:hypothetical protein
MPGGFRGSLGTVFSLVLEAGNPGTGTLSILNPVTFYNDGLGTPASTTAKLSSIIIQEKISTSTVISVSDRIPPESFIPQVIRDPNLFNGHYFLVFETQDKQTGMDHYEVSEVSTAGKHSDFPPSWEPAESPYLLRDQSLSSDIYVRAVDQAGNFIVTKLPARYSKANGFQAISTIYFAIALLLILLVLLYVRSRSRSFP